ncbi:winged helix-turn-helix transcriptional regulator [Actinomadura syzygii]|uniref:HxlR family transcriptional regulator n=1 Tax=Actinomadura syzygii TaxID=1427538 RepID=A0A5D0TPU4_9ACTN|nr:winged helix-turn-helix transcriptional regulator [Actinomadura syzygii]TYC07346.1 HxlR family transcriptional regulator [Actinomadura syzygii]
MPTSRSYRDSCGVARALDVVGERWALLIVRELLLTPQRFSELRHALPHVSSNVLADRLRELENNGVIHRGPAETEGSTAYQLTEWGRNLEPIVRGLGEWGVDAPQPPEPSALSASSVLIFLEDAARPDPKAPPTVCRLDLGGRVWTVRLADGRLRVQAGETATADASLRADPKTLSTLLNDPSTLETARANGSIAVVGDLSAIRRLLHTIPRNDHPTTP